MGDRGMLTQAQIRKLKQHPGLGWISALRGPAIRELVETSCLQLSLFHQTNLAEITSPNIPVNDWRPASILCWPKSAAANAAS